MATIDFPRASQPSLPLPIKLVAIALVVAHAVYLVASYWQGTWITAPDGRGVASDFVNVWAAGKLTLGHEPWLAYDWPAHKAVEDQAVGQSFAGYFGWHYPPMFLFAAAALGLVPYAPAYFAWLLLTFPAYLAVVRAIIGERSGYLLAAAFPALLSNFVVGQNGFLTAGLFGGALVMLERRPALAGVLIGLLTYKPHFGLLIPIVLIAGGHWRTFMSATATALIIAALSLAAFGVQTWAAFFASISHTSQAFLSDGWADFGKLQTIFGLARTLGAPEHAAWTLQAALAITAAFAVVMVWRSKAAYEVKAAALVTGTMLATPYLYTYDLVVLAVPLAFMFRLGQLAGFLRYEAAGMAIVGALIASFPFVGFPVGFLALMIVAALILRRAWVSE
jgi:arabinofuranan 3-O-arabinosyltransferase